MVYRDTQGDALKFQLGINSTDLKRKLRVAIRGFPALGLRTRHLWSFISSQIYKPQYRGLYFKSMISYSKIVQSKFGNSAKLEASCRNWNRRSSSWSIIFLLRTASDTLPTAMNLRQWNICSTVQNVSYVILFMSHHSPCVECLSSCFISGQVYLSA